MHQKITSTLSQYEKIILVGGGTGGHIQPIISLVHGLDNEETKYLWIGGDNSTEEKVAKENNIEFQSIPTLKLATTRSWRSLLYPFYLIAGFGRARYILKSLIEGGKQGTSGGLGRGTVGVRGKKIRGGAKRTSFALPNSFGTFSTKSTENPVSEKNENHSICLFSKGGPGSVAIGLAAWSLSIPLYIHESDTIPGRSNRILGKFADMIFLGFKSATKYFDANRCEVVGQILDPVFEGKVQNIKYTVEWKTTKPHIFVICGSQGSQVIFGEIIKNYSGRDEYEWIISLGKLNSGMKSEFEKIPNCQALEWISQTDIAHLIRDADLAITRGSATTLAELTVSETKPKLIIIPLPYSANNHQYYNSLEYEKMGHVILEQKNLHQLTQTIQHNVG